MLVSVVRPCYMSAGRVGICGQVAGAAWWRADLAQCRGRGGVGPAIAPARQLSCQLYSCKMRQIHFVLATLQPCEVLITVSSCLSSSFVYVHVCSVPRSRASHVLYQIIALPKEWCSEHSQQLLSFQITTSTTTSGRVLCQGGMRARVVE